MRNLMQKNFLKRMIQIMFIVVPLLGLGLNHIYEDSIVLDEYLTFTFLLALPSYWLIGVSIIVINHNFLPKKQ